MPSPNETPLVLGGHSFISQLGNDPAPDEATQRAIVECCLENGIRWFDTTYQPERVALGKALKALGKRNDATIIAWNFFHPFSEGERVGGPDAYQPEHLARMLGDLQTDYIDCLVVHEVDDPHQNEAQLALALEWQRAGRVKKLGCWAPDETIEERYANENPYQFMVLPNNVTTPDNSEIFLAAKRLGWETLACSPYVRGWQLDERVKNAMANSSWTESEARSRIADAMLRYSLFGKGVDRLIVSMRKIEWVQANVTSAKRGPLTPEETALLQ